MKNVMRISYWDIIHYVSQLKSIPNRELLSTGRYLSIWKTDGCAAQYNNFSFRFLLTHIRLALESKLVVQFMYRYSKKQVFTKSA